MCPAYVDGQPSVISGGGPFSFLFNGNVDGPLIVMQARRVPSSVRKGGWPSRFVFDGRMSDH